MRMLWFGERRRTKRILFCAWILTALGFAELSAQAQNLAGSDDSSGKNAADEQLIDPYRRTSPRGTVNGYLSAVREGDFSKAGLYIDLSGEAINQRKFAAARYARQLRDLMDHGGYFLKANEISISNEGRLDDELEPDLEQVGIISGTGGDTPLLLQRVNSNGNVPIWLISKNTVKQIPSLLASREQSLLDQALPPILKSVKIATVPIGHWIAVLLIAVLSIGTGYVVGSVMLFLLNRHFLPHRSVEVRSSFKSSLIPLSFVIGIPIYRAMVLFLGVQIVARGSIDWIAVVSSWVAIAWLGTRLVDGVAEYARQNMPHTDQLTSVAAISLARRLAKAGIVAITVVIVLDVLGFDVTTGLAAMGIGGLALALGAQRTVENLVGSVTVVADKPIRVGDFCKLGDVSGTVEDIGIRSTQIRTVNRTVVTVPNGALSSMQIENYSVRDKFLFNTTLTLRYETTPSQIKALLKNIQNLLEQHPQVEDELVRTRLISLSAYSIDLEVYAHIFAENYSNYLQIREALLLEIMELVKGAATDFAFPSQTLYMASDQ